MKPIAQNTLIQNRYLVVHMIGKGGMGEVYLAIDQRLGSAVALKRTFYSDDEMLGNAFEREAKTLARLRHPVLTKVSDHFVENETQFLVMEHISGEDLSKRLEVNNKPFPLSWVLFWADQLLDALTYLHSHEPPIIHRDIKPQNLKLTAENNIVLLDFGLSKNNAGQTRISTSGSVVGYTPHYAPMEQIRGMGTDERSDIFSLSATLYQLLTNVIPADALTRADSILSGMSDPIQPLNEINPEVSEELSDVILKGMSLSLDQRFASARQMQKALREAFAGLKKQKSAPTSASNQQKKVELPQSQLVTEVISLGSITNPPAAQTESNNIPESNPAFENSHQNSNSASSHRQNQQTDEPDFEATIPYTPVDKNLVEENLEEKQSFIKTEVFNAGSLPEITAAQEDDFSQPESFSENEESKEAENFSQTENFAAEDNFEPDENYSRSSTIPLFSYDDQTEEQASTSFDSETDFDSISVDDENQSGTENFSPTRNYSATELADSIPAAVASPKNQSTKKGLIIFGGIAALLILMISATGIGWYLLSGSQNVTFEETPMPTPQETIEVVPTPEPTLEAVIETNSNSLSEESLANSNANTEIVEQTENKTNKSQTSTPNPVKTEIPKSTERVATVKTPKTTPEKTPTPKKTPVKSDRTDILQ